MVEKEFLNNYGIISFQIRSKAKALLGFLHFPFSLVMYLYYVLYITYYPKIIRLLLKHPSSLMFANWLPVYICTKAPDLV